MWIEVAKQHSEPSFRRPLTAVRLVKPESILILETTSKIKMDPGFHQDGDPKQQGFVYEH
jgi:hypothetical protein